MPPLSLLMVLGKDSMLGMEASKAWQHGASASPRLPLEKGWALKPAMAQPEELVAIVSPPSNHHPVLALWPCHESLPR